MLAVRAANFKELDWRSRTEDRDILEKQRRQTRSREDICCQDRLSQAVIEVEKPETLGSKASKLLEAGDLREGG
ncbi:hypothetical protein PHISCL_08574 [Aspergillus sclerotialis]|uniref:Uncharacterized protein n=1 Tax=Aspergillus sclerotialis TaxID=2070753 RepID=A0A3A2ZPS3_9EURO|nr:hypothetical protein PHISCL_08574 [Aspergillus sclerotialis]